MAYQEGANHFRKPLRDGLEVDIFGDMILLENALQKDLDVLDFVPRITLVARAFCFEHLYKFIALNKQQFGEGEPANKDACHAGNHGCLGALAHTFCTAMGEKSEEASVTRNEESVKCCFDKAHDQVPVLVEHAYAVKEHGPRNFLVEVGDFVTADNADKDAQNCKYRKHDDGCNESWRKQVFVRIEP